MIKTNKLKPYLFLKFIVFVVVVMTAGGAFAVWLDPAWGFRQKITINLSSLLR